MKVLILTDVEHMVIQESIKKRIEQITEKLEDHDDDAEVLGDLSVELVNLQDHRNTFARPLKNICNELIGSLIEGTPANLSLPEYFEAHATIMNAMNRVKALEPKTQE